MASGRVKRMKKVFRKQLRQDFWLEARMNEIMAEVERITTLLPIALDLTRHFENRLERRHRENLPNTVIIGTPPENTRLIETITSYKRVSRAELID